MSEEIAERDHFFAEVKQTINDFLQNTVGARLAFIATIDGHLVYEVNREGLELAELAPMTATLAGLGGGIAQSLHQGDLSEVIVRMSGNSLVVICMGDEDANLVFSILAGSEANLGMLLFSGRVCSEKLMTIFNQMD